MDDNQFKQYILCQLEDIRDALLDQDEHRESICYNLGVLMATIDFNIQQYEDDV